MSGVETVDGLPFGLELVFESSDLPEQRSAFHAIVIPIHWAIVSSSHRAVENYGDTEILRNLEGKITRDGEQRTCKVEQMYKRNDGKFMMLKVLEVIKDVHVAVTVTEMESKQSNAITLDIKEFVQDSEAKVVWKVYNSQSILKLEKRVKQDLLGQMEKQVQKITAEKSAYESKLSAEQEESIRKRQEEDQAKRRRDEQERSKARQPHPSSGGGGVGFVPPTRGMIPPGIGRSDLDPFGGIGSGMLMDPRGFRGGGIRPPRYDPIGPVPGGMFGPPRPGGLGGPGRAPPLPFGVPDPDHERVPDGFNDMFM